MHQARASHFGKKAMSILLSGAMVVAFAPAIAAPLAEAAATGDSITVTFDANGGTLQTGKQDIADQTVKVSATPTQTEALATVDATTYLRDGYSISRWWYDADGDGVELADEDVDPDAGMGVEIAANLKAGSTITLKAMYAQPYVKEVSSFAIGQTAAKATHLSFYVANPLSTAQTMTALLYKDGAQIASETVKLAAATASTGPGNKIVTFDNTTAAFEAAYGAGNYIVKLKDASGATMQDDATFTIDKLKLTGGMFATSPAANASTVLALDGATYADALNAAAKDGAAVIASSTDKTFEGYQDATGTKLASYASSTFSGTAEVTADATLSAYYNDTAVGALAYDAHAKTFTLTPENADKDGYTYAATLTTPSGASLSMELGTGTASKPGTFVYDLGSASPATGIYSATLTATKGTTTTSYTGAAQVHFVTVSYAVGEGSYASGTTAPASSIVATGGSLTVTDVAPTAPENKKFAGWNDGISTTLYQASDSYVVPEVTGDAVTLTASYKTAYSDEPSYKYDSDTGYLTLSQDNGDGYKVQYSTDAGATWTDYNTAGSGIKADPSQGTVYYAKTVATTTSGHDSQIIAIEGYGATTILSNFDALYSWVSSRATVNSTASSPQTYSTVLADTNWSTLSKQIHEAVQKSPFISGEGADTVAGAKADADTFVSYIESNYSAMILSYPMAYNTTQITKLETPVATSTEGLNTHLSSDEAAAYFNEISNAITKLYTHASTDTPEEILESTEADVTAARKTAAASMYANAPTLSVSAGTYTSAQTITISGVPDNARVYYSTDGSKPTTRYDADTGIVLKKNGTYPLRVQVNAGSTSDGTFYKASGETDATYVIKITAGTPSVSLAAGTWTGTQYVTIGAQDAADTLKYTTDGTDPTSSSTAVSIDNLEDVTISKTTLLKVAEFDANGNPGAVVTKYYRIVKPSKVSGLKAKAGSKKAALTWKEVKGSTQGYIGYDIAYKKAGDKSYRHTSSVNAKKTIKKLAKGKTYSFKVRASVVNYGKVVSTGKYSSVVKAKIK